MRGKLGLPLHFGNVPHPWALPLGKHEAKFINEPNPMITGEVYPPGTRRVSEEVFQKLIIITISCVQ
jgi:hypothetical protein